MAVKTILVIDDEYLTRISLADFLQDAGYNTTAVTDGKTALQAQKKFPFDVCIVDIRIPNLNGIETIIALHRISSHTRYIIYTGLSQFTLTPALEGIGLTRDSIVRKPVLDMGIFLQLIKRLANSEMEG